MKKFDLVEDISVHWSWANGYAPFGRVSNFSVQRCKEERKIRIVIENNPIEGQLSCGVLKAILNYYCYGSGNPDNIDAVEAIMKKDENEKVTRTILEDCGFECEIETENMLAFKFKN